MEFGVNEGESPVADEGLVHGSLFTLESRSLGVLRKMGGKFHPNLNITQRPIAEKYCEGKLKRIAKAKLKVPEIVSREPFGGSGAAVVWFI
jgi:hypothetical protein